MAEEMDTREQKFARALHEWIKAAMEHAAAREACRLARAEAELVAEGKNVEQRKAHVDIKTSDMRKRRDTLEIEAHAAYHRLIFLRGSAGEGEVRK